MNTKIYFLLIALMLTTTIVAADAPEYPYQKQIQNGDYAKAEKEIVKKLSQSYDDVPLLFAASELFFAHGNPSRDVQKAYTYACDCRRYYESAPDKEVQKWLKHGLTIDVVKTAIHDRCLAAQDAARKTDRVADYESFLGYYTQCSDAVRNQVVAWRDEAAFRDATERNTVDAYEDFLHRYPDALQAAEAQQRIYNIAFEQAVSKRSKDAYADYIKQYPYSPRVLEMLNIYSTTPYRNGEIRAYNWRNYRSIARSTDPQKILATMLTQRELMRLAVAGKNQTIAEFGYHNFYDPMLDSCWLVLHSIYSSTGQRSDMEELYRRFPNDHFPDIVAKEEQMLMAAKQFFDDQSIPVEQFIRTAAPSKMAYDQMVHAIASDLDKGNTQACIRYCEQFAQQFGTDKMYQSLMKILRAKDEKVEKQPLPSGINTAKGKEYLPIPSADGNTLYFVGQGRLDNLGGEDIYVSTKDSTGAWQPSTVVKQLSWSWTNEGVHSVSTNGATLIVFKEGRLQLTTRTTDGWSKLKWLPSNINISSWQCDAMISSDGKAMLFAARYPTPYEKDTSINIFVSLLDSAGNWSKPFDLGSTINTPHMERAPFLHPDMKTLYFSSAGHGGLGGLDVYKSTRLSDDSWTDWSEPVNIGRQLNTPRNDWGYKFTTDGKTAYFSDGEDIYSVVLPESMRPNAVATISGHVIDGEGKPAKVAIRWEDLDAHKQIGQSETNVADGAFFLVLPLGKMYGYYIDDEHYYPLSNNIDLREITEMTAIQKEIQLVSYKQMVDEGIAVQVNNLFFPVNEYELLPQSEDELMRVAAIIKSHNFRVEVSGHTDSSGDAKKNKVLSQRRADSVRDFLIQAGCAPDMLTAKGYGSAKPVADNTTEEGKQQNRRVELRFVDK